ncbi:MAG: thiamine diphosphokinase [Oscillospiraceae bacterium]|nr:thiamine diphosphokinase [Oscillospiraceae bacterium]
MKTKCLIISGGDFAPLPVPDADTFVIACDRGYAYAIRCGILPDLLVSDFDSYIGPVDSAVPLQRLPTEKDDTDTMSAVRAALARGCTEGLLCCALGGRLDHTLANLQSLLFAEENGLRLCLRSPDTEGHVLKNGTLRLKRRDGFSLSVFSLSERCRGVSLHGVKYELEDVELTNAFPLGVSNEWRDEEAEIRVQDGALLIVLSKL